MKSRISEILSEITKKKNELFEEYSKLKDKYNFSFVKWKIIFDSKAKEENKKKKVWIVKYIFSAQVRHLLSLPFIYSMVVPTLILDLFLFVYQNICFRLYWIPLVYRKDFIDYDRKELDYLNIIQKFHCLYCSYVNGIFAFAVEVAWRTEKYRCPIKHARKNKSTHDWHEYFADYWDAQGFKDVYNKNHEFYNKS